MFTFLGRQLATRQHQLSSSLLTQLESLQLFSAARSFNTVINTNTTTRPTHLLTTKTTTTTTNVKRNGSNSAAYQGDGKTTVRVLNQEDSNLNLVNTYSAGGFRLHNNLFIYGSIILFPTNVFSWAVRRGVDITEESLLVFDLIVPKIKILIIGYGQYGEPYDASIPLKLKQKGINCEMIATPQAVTTYNYLVHDSVHVAGAFVPVIDDVKMTARDGEAIMTGENNHERTYDLDRGPQSMKPEEMDIQADALLRKHTVYRELDKKKFDE